MTHHDDPDLRAALIEETSKIVCAFVSHNAVPVADLPGLISRTYEVLTNLTLPQIPTEEAPSTPVPAVPVRKSITDNYLVCLEDGKKFKSLRRHLASQYNMTPAAYRQKWGLGADYPMVAPAYGRARSALAKEMGLGSQRKKALARKPTKTAA